MKRWPLNKAFFWEKYPFFRLLLPLVVGIWVYPQSAAQHTILLFSTLSAGLAVIVIYSFVALSRQDNLRRVAGAICMHIAIFSLSWSLCYLNDVRNDKDWFGNSVETADSFKVIVKNAPAEKDKTLKLVVDVISAKQEGENKEVYGNAFVYVFKYGAPAIREGDILTVPNEWLRIKNRGNPFEFDYAKYCARRNIHFQQFVSGEELTFNKLAEEKDLPLVRRIHNWCMRQLEWYIKDRPTLGLLKAMLIGDRETLDEELTDAYAATGIVHVMAISGAHISVFFLLVAFMLLWLRHRKYHWVKYIAAIPLIWLYVLIAGAPPSAVRAATMFTILGMGFAMQKEPNGVNQLLAAGFVLLCANPGWLYTIGFQLSFVAVLSIFIFYKPIHRLYTPAGKLLSALWSAIAVSIAAEILIAPLVVYYFHLFPLQFVVANVLAYLFMGVILIGGMLLVITSFSYTIGSLLGIVITWLVEMFNRLVFYLQEFNFSAFSRLTLNEWQLLLIYILIFSLVIGLRKQQNKRMLAARIALCLLFVSGAMEYRRTQKQKALIVYNVSGKSYIETISGRTTTVLYEPEEVEEKVKKFVLTPAHINMHVNNVERSAKQEQLVKVGSKTVFIANKLLVDTVIQADYIVINYKLNGEDLNSYYSVYGPATMVLPTNMYRSSCIEIAEEAREIGIATHNVYEEGAFVLATD